MISIQTSRVSFIGIPFREWKRARYSHRGGTWRVPFRLQTGSVWGGIGLAQVGGNAAFREVAFGRWSRKVSCGGVWLASCIPRRSAQ